MASRNNHVVKLMLVRHDGSSIDVGQESSIAGQGGWMSGGLDVKSTLRAWHALCNKELRSILGIHGHNDGMYVPDVVVTYVTDRHDSRN